MDVMSASTDAYDVSEVKFDIERMDTAFRGRLYTYRLLPEESKINLDISMFLSSATGVINAILETGLDQHRNVKVNCFMECLFEHQVMNEETEFNFITKNFSIYGSHDLPDFLQMVMESLETEAEETEMKGSGWSFVRVNFMDIRINKLNQLRGGCAITLPVTIKNSKSVVNVMHSGKDCFKFAIYGKYLTKHRSKANTYYNDRQFLTRYSWDSVSYPVALNDIGTFEKRNNISINVYGVTETNVVYPLRISDQERQDHRDLLLYQDHYCWISNLQRLVSRQICNVRHSHLCKRCFSLCTTKEKLSRHVKNCTIVGIQEGLLEDVPIPKNILQKSAIVYCKRNPESSFRLAAIDGMEEEDVMKYDWNSVNNVKTSVDDVKEFQSINNISINLYSFTDKGTVFPIYVGNNECKTHRDLLFVKTSEGNYFYQILDLSRLVSSQKTEHEHRIHLCKRCFAHYHSEENLNRHRKDCLKNQPTRTGMPTKGENILKFTKTEQTHRVPFVIYANWECLLIKLPRSKSNAPTLKYQEHEPCSFCYYIVATDGSSYEPRLYVGPNAISIFFQMLVADVEELTEKYLKVVPMKRMTSREKTEYNEARECSLCQESFTFENHKVHDHCLLTGAYRQPLCRKCNGTYQNPSFVPVLIHNFSKYYSKCIVRGMRYDDEPVSVLANSDENFISLSKTTPSGLKIRFLDSFRFLPESLEKLAKKLPSDMFKHTARYFKDPLELSLVCQKQILCYDSLSNWDVLKEEKLPAKDKFRNKIYDCDISDEDYDHVKKVWEQFRITNLGEYVKLYLKKDLLILADVFEGFRDLCMKTFGIDACWNYSSSGLTWQSFLKYTKVEIELLTDQCMYSLFRRATRGGISQCSLRHIQADNNQPGELSEDSISIGFVDVVNLYGLSMSCPLPYGGFRWMTRSELNNLFILNTSDDDEEGYLLECDLTYPEHLHSFHNELPFLPESKPPPGSKCKKLLANLEDKVQYPLHIRALRQALKNGLQLKHIHRGIAFRQSCFMKPYIDLNTNMREAAGNDFEKNFFKLMINSCYEKTRETQEECINYEIVTSEERFEKIVASNNFKSASVVGDNVVGVSKSKTIVWLDRPTFIGASVLDISKTIVYELFYGHFKKLYEDKITLAYMDAGSFLMKMKGTNIEIDILKHPEVYETSNYPKDHPLFSQKNMKVPGMLINVTPNHAISEFVGLRSKCYAMTTGLCENCTETKICKGVKRNVVEMLRVYNYRRCLYNDLEIKMEQNQITSTNQRLFSSTVNRLSLSSRDDKRFILKDNVSTLAHGNFQLKELEIFPKSSKRKYEDVEDSIVKCCKRSPE